MAKKRRTSRSRKVAKPRASARKRTARRGKAGETDPMNVIAALLVLVLVGLGIYFYQLNHKEAAMSGSGAPVAMEKK